MNSKAFDYFLDPLKGRVLIELGAMKKATVFDLCARCPNIPKSTMYRYLAKMEKDGVVFVASVVKKRGTIEKTYSISDEILSMKDKKPSKEQMKVLFLQFCSNMMFNYNRHIDETEKIEDMRVSFTTAPVYASDQELQRAMFLIGNAVQELMQNKPSPERKMYSLNAIVVPSFGD